jgi:hypothetical protein
MRPIKLLALISVSAAAIVASVGAATANAGIHEAIGYCLKGETLLCAPANLVTIPAGGFIILLLEAKNSTLENNALFSTPEKCGVLKLGLLTNELMNNPIAFKIVEDTHTECSGPCKKIKSSASETTPAKGTLSMSTVGGSEWNPKAEEGSVLLSECTFGVECEYGVPAGGITLNGSNGAEGAIVKANKINLTLKKGSEFTCGATVAMTSEYKATGVDLQNAAKEIVAKHGKFWFTLLGEVDRTH